MLCASVRHAQNGPVGPENRDRLVRTLTGLFEGSVVCSWGVHGAYRGQDIFVLGWLRELDLKLAALGFMKDGRLNHPLYVPHCGAGGGRGPPLYWQLRR